MEIIEIGTGYTSIPARMGAATEIVVEELTKGLLANGQRVTLVDIQDPNRLPNELPIVEVPLPKCFAGTDVALGIMHKLKRVVYSVALAKKLHTLIRQSTEPVVLHFHNQYNLFFFLKLTPAKLRKQVKIAYTVHSYIWHDRWEKIQKVVQKRYFQELDCIRKADKVYVLNEQTRRTLKCHVGIDEKRMVLIDNGVNAEIYHPLDPKTNDKKLELNLEGKRVFIQVGSVCDRKNQMEAVKLLAPLMKEHSDIVFVYAGGVIDSTYMDGIVRYAEENGLTEQVRYLGELEPGRTLNQYYSMADAMVFPSKSEGFSLVVIEAMASGTPVIINDQLEFKLADKCLRYNTAEEFVALVKSEILDEGKRGRNAAACRNAVVCAYNWEKVARDYLSSWSEVVS